MGRTFAGLVALLSLAAAGCLAGSDSYDAAIMKGKEDMEMAGYECIGVVGVEQRPADVLAVDPLYTREGDESEVAKTTKAVEDLWTANGWGRPEDVESIAFLEDGTMCVRKKGGSTMEPASGGSGRRLFRHTVRVPQSRNADGFQMGTSRRLNQEASFESELPIPEGEDQIRVPLDKSIEVPFSMVGNVGEECSGILVGPCHFLTAGHCVFDADTFQVIGNSGFNPGRNGVESLFPLGRFRAVSVFPSKNWTMRGDLKYDAAIVQVQGRPGDEIGFMNIGAEGLPDVVGLNIAGYPVDKPLGQMWMDFCDNVELKFGTGKKEFVFHNCNATGGNSGSPMWVYTPADGNRQVAAIHTSSTIQPVSEDPLRFAVMETATFLEGELLKELQDALAQAECSAL